MTFLDDAADKKKKAVKKAAVIEKDPLVIIHDTVRRYQHPFFTLHHTDRVKYRQHKDGAYWGERVEREFKWPTRRNP